MTDKQQPGDVAIELGGRRLFMRPSYKAVYEIEEATGAGIIALARRLLQGEGKMSEAAAVITAGLRAAGEPASFDKVSEMVFEDGVDRILGPVLDYLSGSLTGGRGARAKLRSSTEDSGE